MTKFTGPFDVAPFPDKLDAHVVTAQVAPLVHGYPLLSDLAQRKGFLETVWLAIKGNLPTHREKWLFEKSLYWMSPVHVGEAPSHAAILSRICGSWTSATIMVGAIGLAERSRAIQKEFEPWITFLKDNKELQSSLSVPNVALEATPDLELQDARVQLFMEFENSFGKNRFFDPRISYRREAVALLLLGQLDCLDALTIDFLAVWSSFPLVFAEVSNVNPGDMNLYPARIPEIQYVEAH